MKALFNQVVVPSYRLVWYNNTKAAIAEAVVVVPSYRLVWYNTDDEEDQSQFVVVPSYRLVWYNQFQSIRQYGGLLFPVIAWYGIILPPVWCSC